MTQIDSAPGFDPAAFGSSVDASTSTGENVYEADNLKEMSQADNAAALRDIQNTLQSLVDAVGTLQQSVTTLASMLAQQQSQSSTKQKTAVAVLG